MTCAAHDTAPKTKWTEIAPGSFTGICFFPVVPLVVGNAIRDKYNQHFQLVPFSLENETGNQFYHTESFLQLLKTEHIL
jgi:hypothetical protein